MAPREREDGVGLLVSLCEVLLWLLFPLQLCSSALPQPFGIFLRQYGRRKKLKPSTTSLTSVRIAQDSTFCNSCQVVQLHHELAVCQMFNCKYVVFNLKSEKETQAISSVSAVDVLMSSAREKVLPSKIVASSQEPLTGSSMM